MTLYDPTSGFEYNHPETSATINVVLAAWMRAGLRLTPAELPGTTNDLLTGLNAGYAASGMDVGFLPRVAALVPVFMERQGETMRPEQVRELIVQIGESFAAVRDLTG